MVRSIRLFTGGATAMRLPYPCYNRSIVGSAAAGGDGGAAGARGSCNFHAKATGAARFVRVPAPTRWVATAAHRLDLQRRHDHKHSHAFVLSSDSLLSTNARNYHGTSNSSSKTHTNGDSVGSICSTKDSTSSLSVWERNAVKVKNTEMFSSKNNPYLEALRATHDPQQHIRTIEDELKASIGQALGKQGQKLLSLLRQMNQELQRYHELCHQLDETQHAPADSLISRHFADTIQRYNDCRKAALTARWELMVQRQAAGFVVNNHAHMTEHYPIPPALVWVEDTATDTTRRTIEFQKKKPAKDQLDWWQRVGRWK